jgi:toxin ParE1/3/4
MHAHVAEYRLSLRAHADLLNIYAFSEAKFGRYQAEAYHAGLERTFGLLGDFPGIGIAADELVVGHRRFRFQSHYILVCGCVHVRLGWVGWEAHAPSASSAWTGEDATGTRARYRRPGSRLFSGSRRRSARLLESPLRGSLGPHGP